EHFTDGVDGHAACNITREGATHTIGHNENQAFCAQIKTGKFFWSFGSVGAGPRPFFRQLEHEEIVLVAPADSSDIRFCVQLDVHGEQSYVKG
ncbi:MAG: hypothetical protein ACRD6N_00490, partial [Pyrinomonadaceae bacterium]